MSKRLNKVITLVLISVMLILLPGCYDMKELEQNAFVLAYGLDIASSNPKYVKVTVMIAIPKDIAGTGGGGGEGGGDKEKGLLKTSIEAPTVSTAINLINTYVGRELNFNQASFVFFGEELAKKKGVFRRNFLLRYYEIRRSSRLFVARGQASDVLNLIKPTLSANPNKYLTQVIDSRKFSGLIPEATLHQFNNDVENPNIEGVLPLCGANLKSTEKEIQDMEPVPYEEYIPGELNRIGGVPVEFIGSALFKNDKMIGELNGTETRTLNMIKGDFATGILIFPEIEEKKEFTSIKIIQGQSPKLKVKIDSNRPQINIVINLEGELISTGKLTDYSKEENINKLEGLIESNLKNRGAKLVAKLQKLNNDSLNLGNQIAGKFLTWQDLRNYGWLEKGKFKKADIKLEFHIQIRRVGYQLGPTRK